MTRHVLVQSRFCLVAHGEVKSQAGNGDETRDTDSRQEKN